MTAAQYTARKPLAGTEELIQVDQLAQLEGCLNKLQSILEQNNNVITTTITANVAAANVQSTINTIHSTAVIQNHKILKVDVIVQGANYMIIANYLT